ncbi:hypothetical protein PUN28_016078 [Cardiocondyla obscurior]|uniref:Uncharacterized protein n=1 Tax=Cardiocondyla obscurior TaxID=286306 RepID=A0AAW2EUH6_9HYME
MAKITANKKNFIRGCNIHSLVHLRSAASRAFIVSRTSGGAQPIDVARCSLENGDACYHEDPFLGSTSPRWDTLDGVSHLDAPIS